MDTGAAYSVIPYSSTEPQRGPAISTADRTPIPCWGTIQRRLRAGLVDFEWTFLKAKVAFPILGADFLSHFDLLVELRRRLCRRKGRHLSLIRAGPSYVSSGIIPTPVEHVPPVRRPPTADVTQDTCVLSGPAVVAGVAAGAGGGSVQRQLEMDFKAVFNASKILPPVIHQVEHHIETKGWPVTAKYRQLDATKL